MQGLGAGGLIVLAQTVIGDLVSPRERGRYQGLFSAVFAAGLGAVRYWVASSRNTPPGRWIFSVNLPVGGAALAFIAVGLRSSPPDAAPRLDLLGAMLLIAGACGLLLMLSWGGNVYAWSSTPLLGLAVTAIGSFALLTLVERRAGEPILPPELFRNSSFIFGAALIALAAMALFAAVVFLPLMLQLLMGASPAQSDLMIAPMMGGVIIACSSAAAWFPEQDGTRSFSCLGCWQPRCPTGRSPYGIGPLPIEAVLVVMGLGIGLVMPNLTTAIQNAVPRRDLGAATASAAFFRSLGGALGAGLSGAVLAARLHGLTGDAQHLPSGVLRIAELPAAQRAIVLDAYRTGLSGAFTAGAAIAGLGCVMALFLPERPLRSATK
jgi:Major Facilitator Superfamily